MISCESAAKFVPFFQACNPLQAIVITISPLPQLLECKRSEQDERGLRLYVPIRILLLCYRLKKLLGRLSRTELLHMFIRYKDEDTTKSSYMSFPWGQGILEQWIEAPPLRP